MVIVQSGRARRSGAVVAGPLEPLITQFEALIKYAFSVLHMHCRSFNQKSQEQQQWLYAQSEGGCTIGDVN